MQPARSHERGKHAGQPQIVVLPGIHKQAVAAPPNQLPPIFLIGGFLVKSGFPFTLYSSSIPKPPVQTTN